MALTWYWRVVMTVSKQRGSTAVVLVRLTSHTNEEDIPIAFPGT